MRIGEVRFEMLKCLALWSWTSKNYHILGRTLRSAFPGSQVSWNVCLVDNLWIAERVTENAVASSCAARATASAARVTARAARMTAWWRALYKVFEIRSVTVRHSIAAKKSLRVPVAELLISNY
jgi:hypothetical protein